MLCVSNLKGKVTTGYRSLVKPGLFLTTTCAHESVDASVLPSNLDHFLERRRTANVQPHIGGYLSHFAKTTP